MNRHFIPLVLLSSLLGLFSGCQSSFNTKVYRFEQVTADGTRTVRNSFAAYYHAKTNGLPHDQLVKLNNQARNVGLTSMNVALALKVVDHLRLQYQTNNSPSTYTNILNGMVIANKEASNIVWLVNFYKKQ